MTPLSTVLSLSEASQAQVDSYVQRLEPLGPVHCLRRALPLYESARELCARLGFSCDDRNLEFRRTKDEPAPVIMAPCLMRTEEQNVLKQRDPRNKILRLVVTDAVYSKIQLSIRMEMQNLSGPLNRNMNAPLRIHFRLDLSPFRQAV